MPRNAKLFLPLAIVLGAPGYALRLWALNTAYDARNLPISDAPALLALKALTVAVPFVALLLAATPGSVQAEPGKALYARLPALSALIGMLAGELVCISGLWALLSEDVSALTGGGGRLELAVCAVDALTVAAGLSMVWLCLAGRLGRTLRHSLATLLPGFAGCFRLVLYYHTNSQDPVVSRFCWTLLALLAAILAFYHQAAYSFGRPRPVVALTATVTAAAYALSAQAGAEGLAEQLLLGGIALWMVLHTMLLPGCLPEHELPGTEDGDAPAPKRLAS